MNAIKTTLVFLVFILFISILIISRGENSEKLIEGNWTEVSWKYEKIDSSEAFVMEDMKHEIYQDLIIHESETWIFKRNKTLFLTHTDSKKTEELTWSLKGRGHILELTHKDGRKEDYQIELLSDDLLIIYFSFDIQIRGVVKITFVKND